jgi:hypothetical protein
VFVYVRFAPIVVPFLFIGLSNGGEGGIDSAMLRPCSLRCAADIKVLRFAKLSAVKPVSPAAQGVLDPPLNALTPTLRAGLG